MSDDDTSNPADELHLVGFRLDPNFPEPDFYVLMIGVDGDVPLMHEGQIILFQQRAAGQEAVNLYFQEHIGQPRPQPPAELTLVVDLPQVFYLLTQESRDESAYVVNAINTLLDLLKAAKVVAPPMYRAALHELADHLTFNRSFGELFGDAGSLDRAEAVEAIQWAVGAMMSKAMFVPKH